MRGPLGPLARMRTVGLVAVSVGLALGGTYLRAPIDLASGIRPDTAIRTHADPVTQTRSICPGPESLGVEGLPDSIAQNVSVAAASAPALALPAGSVPAGALSTGSLPSGSSSGQGEGSLSLTGLPSGGKWAAPVRIRGQGVSGQISTARSAMATGSGTLAPGAVATQWSWTRTGNGRGLVATACMPAAASSWLIAGGGAPGRLEHLVLANPGPNAVTVDVDVFDVKGQIESPDGQGLVVSGHARMVILLDAIAGSQRSPVVHVTTRGGKVAATLNDTWLDGVVPRGGDDVVSITGPALEQVIAGVPIDGRATLRVAVPGAREAVVQSRVLTSRGPRPLPSGGVSRVAGRSTRDLDLSALPPGAYAVQVRADVPVVAAVMVDRRRAAGAPSDLAWSAASLPIRTVAGMALPAAGAGGLTQRLDLAAAGGPVSVRVTTVDPGGPDLSGPHGLGRIRTKVVAIGADSVTTLALDGAASVWVTPLKGLARAAVVTSANDAMGDLLSVTPLADLTLTATPWPLRQLGE